MSTSRTTQSGFSLVETLVAITILLIVVVGPMTIAANATRGSNFSTEQTVASFLAQEGLELAQKARDDRLLPKFEPSDTSPSTAAWNEFTGTGSGAPYDECFNNGSGSVEQCGLTIATDGVGTVDVVDCAGSTNRSNCRLYLDKSANSNHDIRSRYTHNTTGADGLATTITPFTRIITMNETNDDREIEVVSTVTWTSGNQQREQSVQAITYLYNVYDR